MKIGFIGTGVISEAIIRGLMINGKDLEFLLSRRTDHISSKLTSEFSCIDVLDDNQAIIDAADVVVLAVRPQIAEEVLSNLNISSEKQVISLIATLTHSTLQSWFGTDVSLCRAIPLPFVADGLGITAICPHQDAAENLFARVGTVISANTQAEFDLYGVASATMGIYFETLSTLAGWMTQEGTPESNAQAYFAALFHGLNQTALKQSNIPFHSQVPAHCTVGGLNEQAVNVFKEHGGNDALIAALDSLKERLSQSSDLPLNNKRI